MTPRTKTDMIVIHCSATPADMDIGVEKIKHWHVVENGWDDVGYHYVIKRDGTLETGRDESMVGSHARAVNGTSIGICLIGGSNKSGDWENNFLPEQFDTLEQLISTLQDKYDIKKIIGHYEVDDKKKCPSFNVKEWLDNNGISNT
jgi:N-acetylmuramoyl-L-alanine amidase